jgi:V/A-type H+-transporting ATPase subunit K
MKAKAALLALVAALLLTPLAGLWAQEQAQAAEGQPAQAAQPVRPARGPLATGLIAISAALAVGLTALGTAIAQSRIGAAGAGTIAEKPETTGSVILLVAIPETMVILGFVIAIVIVFAL